MSKSFCVLKKYAAAILVLMIALTGSYYYISGTVTVSNNVNGRELPISSVETEEKKVSLTFDAAWGNDDIRQVLNILKKYDVRATFFMTGEWVQSYPEDAAAICEAGHDLGNHGEHHRNMKQLSEEEKSQEIMSVHHKVKELTGVEMELFRPPYGDYDDAVILNAAENGYYTVQWNVDSLDWKDYGADHIIQTVLEHRELKNGSIILFHSGAKYMPEALEQVICGLREKGYEMAPVSELIYKTDYRLDVTGRQFKN